MARKLKWMEDEEGAPKAIKRLDSLCWTPLYYYLVRNDTARIPTHGGFTMKSSRDCQIIIGITTQILVRDVCLIPKYDKSSLPRGLYYSIDGEHTCRVRLSKMAQSRYGYH
jgi:hypothetical protein